MVSICLIELTRKRTASRTFIEEAEEEIKKIDPVYKVEQRYDDRGNVWLMVYVPEFCIDIVNIVEEIGHIEEEVHKSKYFKRVIELP